MNFRRHRPKRRVRAAVDMTALVDVVFQLLLFFMLGASFVSSSSIPVEVLEGSALEPRLGGELSITLTLEPGGPDGGGKIYLDQAPVEDWADLSAALASAHDKQPDLPVTIRPDRNVPTGRTVQVLGLVTGAGIQRFYIAAEQPQNAG